MRMLFWLAVAAFAAMLVWIAWYVRRKAEQRRIAEQARAAAFMMDFAGAKKSSLDNAAAATPARPGAPLPPSSAGDIALQKLLFEAAHKAGEAGEPALSVQLYARLLARYPATTLAEPARAAVEALKNKLIKGR